MGDQTWLGVMPAIPLATSVPVRFRANSFATATIVSMESEDGEPWMYSDGEMPDLVDRLDPLVDLGLPQGFGYALRWGWRMLNHQQRHRWLERHIMGTIAAADRLALALALAEVV